MVLQFLLDETLILSKATILNVYVCLRLQAMAPFHNYIVESTQ